MSSQNFDPWDLIAIPMFWFLMGILALREGGRLIWSRLRSKTSPELEL
jgi:hypothetical protein